MEKGAGGWGRYKIIKNKKYKIKGAHRPNKRHRPSAREGVTDVTVV